MLNSKVITRDIKEIEKIGELMTSAFPKDELTPFKLLFDKTNLDGYDFLAFYDDFDNFVGIAYMTTKDDIAYLFWLAVNEEMRNNGIGSKILDALKEIYKDYRIILDIEREDENAPNNSQRIRRRKFYNRNGFTSSDVKYNLYNVDYEILINHGNLERKEFEDMYSYILEKKLNLDFVD